MKKKQPEQELQKAVASYLRYQYPQLLWFHVPNGGKRSKVEGAIFKAMGVRAGVADILLFWEAERYLTRMAAIELKAGSNSLEPTQKKFREDWIGAGGYYSVCRSIDDVKASLELWSVPKGVRA